ncbi:hypothetical protein [Rhizobium lentis]|uniref:RNA polymerase factor sigma-54 n=1 Tax=Rhizobium lentis TaxID=1138194 RepID=UPI003D7E48FC
MRHRIKASIAAEASEVLSDDEIVAWLKEPGISIARRTVTKHREAMDSQSWLGEICTARISGISA